ncbi:hypothetical protein BA950_09280 [Erythrobacter sp. SAORIC-644]|uniref:sensor histidine kinase n=1 Tax=Erythrobacter sp. SAORIC-644 TaxID=1869314 RepID=UPI000C9F781D|nr:sensor histidine kinase [Erythrobacter sp. SAORIC-644]PNQ76003.1 hypothetical protein BA950_09280 [Erythrobacter sp. SAORIC-644]
MTSAKLIQETIDSELQKELPDYSKLANLYDDLADSQQDKVRFSVEASHINRLGLELVGRRETALSELIKNAFDADARVVHVTLEKFDSPGGRMEILDDGIGMSRDVLRSAWMTLSTNSKSGESESPIFGRPRAGRKGIGRFATQRLGKKLLLETHIKGSATGSRVLFSWDEDYLEGQKLSNVWTDIENFECDPDSSGTRLIIEGLRDSWTEASLRKVWKSILFLQPPFPITEVEAAPGSNGISQDPGFQVEINGSDASGRSVTASLENDLLQHALATLSGEIDKDGNAVFSLDSTILNESDNMSFSQKFLLTGPVKFEARYFIFGRKSVPGISVKLAKQLGDEFGGIRIHRNSFRVPPYGEPHNDWLGLDRDVGRRAILPAANNSNFFGHVDINGIDNPLLEETSSREGLVENEALEELRDFVRAGIEWAVLRIAAIRGRKQKATQRDFVVDEKKTSERVEEAFAELDDTVDELDSDFLKDETQERFRTAITSLKTEVINAVQDAEQRFDKERIRNIQYESMLRVLASLGLSVSVFGHEIKSATSSSDGNFSVLKLKIEKIAEEGLRDALAQAADNLKSAVIRVFDLGGYIEDLTSFTGTRKMMPVPVLSTVDRFVTQFSSYLDRHSVKFESSDVQPKSLRTCEMHSSELDSILFNLLTNSMKAFQRVSTAKPVIRISARKEGNFVLLRFEDNGHEIDKEHREKIFDAFYTTTEYSADEVAGPGTGLGLKIVSDIAESYGGGVVLAEPSQSFVTCFEVSIRANSTKDEGG